MFYWSVSIKTLNVFLTSNLNKFIISSLYKSKIYWGQVFLMKHKCTSYNQMKCTQYWPENMKSRQHGNIVIKNVEEKQYAFYVIRKLSVSHKEVILYQNMMIKQIFNDFTLSWTMLFYSWWVTIKWILIFFFKLSLNKI